MYDQINFNSLFNGLKDDEEIISFIKEIFADSSSSLDMNEVFDQFKEGFFSVKNQPDISKQKFYNTMKKILEIERKIDLEK